MVNTGTSRFCSELSIQEINNPEEIFHEDD